MPKKALHIRFDTEELRAKFFDDIPDKHKDGIVFPIEEIIGESYIQSDYFPRLGHLGNYMWMDYEKASLRYSYKTINDISPTLDEKAFLLDKRGEYQQVWEDAKRKEEN